MPPVTPYSSALGHREPLGAIRDALARIEGLTSTWTSAQFERAYAPGKWSARLILVHLAQSEIAFGHRARMTLAMPAYTSQNFDQDAWMAHEAALDGATARAAYLALGRMNLAFFTALSDHARATQFTHPEFGGISIDWLVHQTAGHQLHHMRQIEQIGQS